MTLHEKAPQCYDLLWTEKLKQDTRYLSHSTEKVRHLRDLHLKLTTTRFLLFFSTASHVPFCKYEQDMKLSHHQLLPEQPMSSR